MCFSFTSVYQQTLVNENNVTGSKGAGIQAGETGTTLTINGPGSLNATGAAGAGIGAGTNSTCGNIIINSGTINATGGWHATGIGTCDESTCGDITINGGNITATAGQYAAGIGAGDMGTTVVCKCGNITINGGTVIARGGDGGDNDPAGAGIGTSGGGECGDITITDGVVKVTATKGSDGGYIYNWYNESPPNIGTVNYTRGDKTGVCGTITILGTTYADGYNGGIINGTGGDDNTDTTTVTISDPTTTQTFTVDGKTVTFTMKDGTTTYTIGDGDETTITTGGTITVGEKKYTVTISDGKVTQLKYDATFDTENDQKTVTTSSTRTFTPTFDATQTLYTFAINGENVSVAVDSSGKMTYDGQAVTDNKITVDGVEVTLEVSGNEITGASYLGEYSEVTVTDIEQIDAYKATIDGQEVSLIFDANNQCTVEVNGKNYLLTKTANGATYTSEVETVGVEDSRIYLLEVGGEQYWIGCTFDAAGNLTAVTSDDKNLSIDGTTIKIGDYTIEVGGTKDALKTAATLTVYGEAVRDVEVKQLFTLSGVKSTDGITVENGIVTLTESNLNGEDVKLSGEGYTLALDNDYSPTTTAGEHFEGNVYKSESYSDGYEISDDGKSISYVAETPATNLFTLSGVKSTDGITVVDNVVTLTKANLNGEDVTIDGDGYTLALDKNYSPTTTGEHFEGNVYKSESFSEGYEISDDGKSISYVAETPATNLFTLSGVKSTDGITVVDNVVTLTKANLNGEDVTIDGNGYTLAFADGIKAPTFDAGGWTLSGNVATYKSESNTAGYTLADDGKTLLYTPAHEADISLKVYGVKSLDGLSLDGNVVTVAASSLNQQTVTISKGYTLAIADDVEQPERKARQWTQLDKDTYLYTSGLTTAGYTLRGNTIVYSDEIVTGERYTIKGAANTELITETDEIEAVEEDSLNRRKVVLIETEEHNPESKLVFYGENYAEATVGSGQDSYITYDGARSKADMSDADNVTVVSFDGKIQLENYDMSGGAVILVQDVDDIVDAIKTDSIKLVGNEIQITSSSRVAINKSNNDSTIVRLVNYDGETQAVGFTGINGGNLDTSEYRENFLLKGNYSETSTETKHTGSTMKSGKGNDTILAGSRDLVDGGDGRNEIYLTPYELRDKKDGATIVAGGNSQNTVHNFSEGFNYDGDCVRVENLSNVDFKFESDGLLLSANNARLKFDGVGVNSSSADSESDFGADEPELILLTDGTKSMQAAVAKTEQSILITSDEGLTPNAFFGNRSGLNFSEYGGKVNVNLSDGTGEVGGRDAIFKGINKIQAGDGFSTLIGSDGQNTLVAGDGYTSLTGGADTDKLYGRSGSADKVGQTSFFYFEGDGRDFIYDFEFLSEENKPAGTADKLEYDKIDEKVFTDGNSVVLQLNAEDLLVLTDAVGKDFRVNHLVAKVDKEINFDGLANYYIADGGNSVNVDSTVESAEIWLDNTSETTFVGELYVIDASKSNATATLAGNLNDNTIIAGGGDSSLWGGDGGNDLLIGGGGKNTFFYNFGNGSDTIQGANDGDIVDLTNIKLEQIISTNITADAVSINFVDGGQLNVEGTAAVNFRINGETYAANHDTAQWTKK